MTGRRGAPRKLQELALEEQRTLVGLLDGLREAFGANLFALYTYGAITFPETEGVVDLDFHALLEAAPSDRESAAYSEAMVRLAREHSPWGADPDGWIVLRSEVGSSTPPTHVISGLPDGSWALHRAHWLAGQCIVLAGPPPAEVVIAPAWAEQDVDLRGELEFARRSDHDAFAVLNACRVLHSFTVRDAVQSKFGSAAWALLNLPADHHPVIVAALATYRRDPHADQRALADGRLPLEAYIDSRLPPPR